jgi:hypothetical protein
MLAASKGQLIFYSYSVGIMASSQPSVALGSGKTERS